MAPRAADPAHDVDSIALFLIGLAGSGTFPMSQIADGGESCALLFNDLLASDDDGDTVATWIQTADALTYTDFGVFGIRPEMTEDGAPSAEHVIVTEYEHTWCHFPDIGVAAMPMAVLRDYPHAKDGPGRHRKSPMVLPPPPATSPASVKNSTRP